MTPSRRPPARALSLGLALALASCAHSPPARPAARAQRHIPAETLAGEPFEVGGPGPVRLVELWASWCVPCAPATALARRVLARHPRVVGYAVAIDDDRAAVARQADAPAGPPGPALLYRGGPPAAARAGFDRLPMFLALDADGLVVGSVVGSGPRLDAALERLLADAERISE